MSNSASGQYDDIVGGFSSGPDDTFESVDTSKPVKFSGGPDNRVSPFADGYRSFEYKDIANLKVPEDKINTDTFKWDDLSTYDDYLSGLTDIENLDSNKIQDIKDFYESVTCADTIKSITDWIMGLLDNLSLCGLIEEVSKIATIVGVNKLTSYKPTIVADTLSNFSLGGCGPKIPGSCVSINGLTYNDFSEYANGKFMDTLDSINPHWDVLDDAIGDIKPPFTKGGIGSSILPAAVVSQPPKPYKPTDLSVFSSCSEDAALLFSFHERTREAALVGSGRMVSDVAHLSQEYRPYGYN